MRQFRHSLFDFHPPKWIFPPASGADGDHFEFGLPGNDRPCLLGVRPNSLLFSSVWSQQSHLRNPLDAHAHLDLRFHNVCNHHCAYSIHGRSGHRRLLLRTDWNKFRADILSRFVFGGEEIPLFFQEAPINTDDNDLL
jgi:hypothetical protein